MTDLDYVHWPIDLLPAQSVPFNPVPFTRSGGRSLGGIARYTRTDKGFWQGSLNGIAFRRGQQFDQAREWTKLRTYLNGQAGLLVVPVCSTRLLASPPTWTDFSPGLYPHDDETPFDDDTEYYEGVTRVAGVGSACPVPYLCRPVPLGMEGDHCCRDLPSADPGLLLGPEAAI